MEDNNNDYQQQERHIYHSVEEEKHRIDEEEKHTNSQNRMEKLTMQIQEAKHSLRHYAQNSPLRQNQRDDIHKEDNADASASAAMRDYTTMGEVARSANKRSDMQLLNQDQILQHRNENDKSSDIEQVHGGYTEFFSWGNDDKGQLGHGVDQSNSKRTLNLPKSLSFEVLILSVSCGAQHSGFVTSEGHVFTFGSNLDGQLGIDDRNLGQSTAPLLVSSLLNQGIFAKKIACGSYHTMVHTECDQVYTWGRNQQGQCGQSPSISSKIFMPTLLTFDASHPVSQIECGELTSALITKAGQLYTFGDNTQGQLGLGNGVFRSQVMVDRPTRVQEIHDEVILISCGYRHSLALTSKGQIFGFGSNRRHEMGLGDSSSAIENNFYAPYRLESLMIHNIVHVAAGGFSAAITDQNQLIVWGTGQFGVFSTPQKVCMDGIYFTDIQVSKQESCFATAIDDKGAVYTWGPNFDGQLGQGDFNTRTLPTQIMRLKRKQIRKTALGDRFAIVIGKDVSLADLRRRKAAKQRRQQEQGVNQVSTTVRSSSALRKFSEAEHNARQKDGPPSHRRLNSMHHQTSYSQAESQAVFDERITNHGAAGSAIGRTQDQRHSSMRARQTTFDRQQESAAKSGQSPQKEPSEENNYGNLKLAQNLNSNNNIKDRSNSPLRYKARVQPSDVYRNDDQIAVGGQELGTERETQKNLQLSNNLPPAAEQRVKSPVTLTISRVTQHQQPSEQISRQRSPYQRIHETTLNASNRKDEHFERLYNLQLDEKESVIRQQQTTIQDLRVQITADQREMQSKLDELNDRVRCIEVERNDLRTRIAADLRGYQLAKEDMLQKQHRLEEELASQKMSHQSETSRVLSDHQSAMSRLESHYQSELSRLQAHQDRLQQDFADRVKLMEENHRNDTQNTVAQIGDQHNAQMEQFGAKHRQDILAIDDEHRSKILDMEREKDDLQDQLISLRNLYDDERNKLNCASDDIQNLERSNRAVQDTVLLRGKEIRDLQEKNEQIVNHLKSVEIERDTMQERMQVTVSQLNQDTNELQKSIGLQNVRLEEAKQREDDLLRQLEHEREMMGHRDRRIDELMSEVTCHRKQIEDLNYRIKQDEAARSDLNLRFEDLKVESTTQQEKLRQNEMLIENQGNTIQASRLQLERERQRADVAQNDLDAQHSINAALRRDLSEEQRRVQNREQDIKNLEMALNQLKESMGQEFAAKSRDFENMKRAFEELQHQHESVNQTLVQRNDELDSVQGMNRELQAHANTLLDKVTYQESVIVDLEEKNKRLTDLLNEHLMKSAQNYKENVLAKLTQGRGTPAPIDNLMGHSVSAFRDNNQQIHSMRATPRSATPDMAFRRTQNLMYVAPAHPKEDEDSSRRLAQILRREQGESDTLNNHYLALQQQLNRDKASKSPIRGHEVDFAGIFNGQNPPQLVNHGTVSMTNIAGPNASPRPNIKNKDSIPTSIFNNINFGMMSTNAAAPPLNNNASLQNYSPLRASQKSPTPINVTAANPRERMQNATATASKAHQRSPFESGLNTVQANVDSNINLGNRAPISTFNPLTSSAMNLPTTTTANYSPLRSKTPSKEEKERKEQDAAQLKNNSISASNISHRVMMNELKNLRGQIADVQRQKNDLEGRLSNYETATQYP